MTPYIIFSKCQNSPDLLLDMYPGADLKSLNAQLGVIMEIGEESMDKETLRKLLRSDSYETLE